MAGWGWPISIGVVLIGAVFWPLVNKVPSSVSMDEFITMCMMENYTYSGPLGSGITVGGLVESYSWVPKKKNTPAQFCPSETLK